MIALDTSSLSAFLEGKSGEDADLVDAALAQKNAVLPPVVLTEILSDPKIPSTLSSVIREIPLLDVKEGFWERAGFLRSGVLKTGHKARLADTLIAQSCIDHDVPLVTRDPDFRHFVKRGLRLL